jgi:hypothetical protein
VCGFGVLQNVSVAVTEAGLYCTYKQLAAALFVADSARSVVAAPLVRGIVAAEAGKLPRAPVEGRVAALAAFLSLIATPTCEG